MKYEQALSDAKDARTSPYALSQKELINLASSLHLQGGVTLDTNINHVHAMAFITNGTLGFIFEVPIISDANTFHMYLVTPVPIFGDNKTYIPDVDATNIAIDKSGQRYTTLSDQELSKCLDTPPICKSSRPTYPLTFDALCVVTSYTSDKRNCPLREIPSRPAPFLFFEGLTMFYSVPQSTTVYVKCDARTINEGKTDASTEIRGIGEIRYRPGCTINVQGQGMAYKTPSASIAQNINDWPIFDLKRNLFASIETKLVIPNQENAITGPASFYETTTYESPSFDSKPSFMDVFSEIYYTLFAVITAVLLTSLPSISIAYGKQKCNKEKPVPNPPVVLDDNSEIRLGDMSLSLDDLLATMPLPLPIPGRAPRDPRAHLREQYRVPPTDSSLDTTPPRWRTPSPTKRTNVPSNSRRHYSSRSPSPVRRVTSATTGPFNTTWDSQSTPNTSTPLVSPPIVQPRPILKPAVLQPGLKTKVIFKD